MTKAQAEKIYELQELGVRICVDRNTNCFLKKISLKNEEWECYVIVLISPLHKDILLEEKELVDIRMLSKF